MSNVVNCTVETLNIVNNCNSNDYFSNPTGNTPQSLLLQYIKEDDDEELKNLLEEGRADVNYFYNNDEEYLYRGKTALHISCFCFNETSEKCIELLLKFGANIFDKDKISEKDSLNFAAESGNCRILKILLRYIQENRIDLSNSDVIYSLVRNIWESNENEEKFVPVLRILLKTSVNINYEDLETGRTAVYLAAKYKYKEIIKEIIKEKFNVINLDEFKDTFGKTARDIIIENNLYEGDLPEIRIKHTNINIQTLFRQIRENNLDEFKEFYVQAKTNNILNDEIVYRLLKLAIKHNYASIVKYLLPETTELNLMTNENPLVLASQLGYHKIVEIFMTKNPSTDLVTYALFELLKSPYYTSQISEKIDYKRCVKLLKKKDDVNFNNLALQYALKYRDQDLILEYLQKGATLSSKDPSGELLVADIDSETLEKHLNATVRYNEDFKTSNDTYLVINYTAFLPPKDENKSKLMINGQNMEMQNLVSTESQNNEQKSSNEEFVPETEVINFISTSEELKKHLKHPVITLYINHKWEEIQNLVNANIALYIFFLIFLMAFSYLYSSEDLILFSFFYAGLVITLVLLIIREISQIVIFKLQYFYKFENYLEITLFILTIIMLASFGNEDKMRQISAITIILANIENFLHIGRLKFISTYITMFGAVCLTFFKLFLLYSILLFAYSYSFFTLFRKSEVNDEVKVEDGKNCTEEEDFFDNFGTSMMKTIVMLTGEFDASDIKFDLYPVVSHLLFLTFVFFITIVLFNLLNGLAVSDTQQIKNNAELYDLIKRIEFISQVELTLNTKKKRKLFRVNMDFHPLEIKVYPFKNWSVEGFTTSKVLTKNMQQLFKALINQKKDEEKKMRLESAAKREINEIKQLIKNLQQGNIRLVQNSVETLNIVTNN